MKEKTDYVDMVLKIIIVLGIIFIIYWGLQLLLGGSPTLTQFNTGLIVVLVSLLAHLYYKSGKFNQFVDGTFPRFEKNIDLSFERVKEDMDLIKRKLEDQNMNLKSENE